MTFDLAQFDVAAEGEWLTILHPATSAPLEADGGHVKVHLVGQDSTEYRGATRRNADRRLRAARKGGGAKLSAAELESDALEVLVACTKSWEGFRRNGEVLACTPENVRAVYTQYPFIREQVEEFITDRANFMPS